MVLDRSTSTLEHRHFADILEYLRPGDLLAINDSRVVPVRLRARRSTGGAVELLLVEPADDSEGVWRALARPGKSARPGTDLEISGERDLRIESVGRNDALFELRFTRDGTPLDVEDVVSICDRHGETPLPPYIDRAAGDERSNADRDRYQTVYARSAGSAAAPTAGLHFTRELLDRIAASGVEIARVTLHVGIDTFRPLTDEALASGELHGERVSIDAETGERLLEAKEAGRRIVAVGTTTARTLESFARACGPCPYEDRTTLFLRPGDRFQMVDALVTNFHLPRSSLLLLVSAFAGQERILAAYREAIERGYRFYSYGDAMLLV